METYIYGLDREVYGAQIQVSLLRFKRAERKFHGKEELKTKIGRDIKEGRHYHGLS